MALKHEYLRRLVGYRLDCVGSEQLAGTRGYLMATDTQVLVVARYLARLGTEVERRVAVRACFSSLSFALALGARATYPRRA
jgi:hypothetical protein